MFGRLASIMMLDIFGYARMVSLDEEGTVRRMLRLRAETIEPLVARYGGRIVDYAGDGALVEFASAVAAMRCAMAVHLSLREAERLVPRNRRFRLRIGLDMGRVLSNGGGISGKHVNIASRLEALAAPGGICLSGHVHDAIQGQLCVTCMPGGYVSLKNILPDVEVWFWLVTESEPHIIGAMRQRDQAMPSIRVLEGCDVQRGVLADADPERLQSSHWS